MKEKGKMIEWGMRYKAFPLAFALVLVALESMRCLICPEMSSLNLPFVKA